MALPLAAGQRLGLAIQILGNVQNFRRLTHLAVDLILGHLFQLQGEGHVFIHGHVGVQGVVLEHHGDITILGLHVVHQSVADPQLAGGNVLQTGDHPQGGGLAAAGGADQHDKLLVGDLQTELLDGHDALLGDLEIVLLLRLLALLDLFLLLGVGVDLLQILQYDLCHIHIDCSRSASAKSRLAAAFRRAALRQVSTLPHRQSQRIFLL